MFVIFLLCFQILLGTLYYPNRNQEWRFDNASENQNIIKFYSNWAMKSVSGKFKFQGLDKIRYEYKRCLGVLKCNNCNILCRPKIPKKKSNMLEKTCPSCSSTFSLIECSASLRFEFNKTQNKCIVKHINSHFHECPPISKLDFNSKKAFYQKLESNINQKPLQLVVGSANPLKKKIVWQIFMNVF